MADITRYYIHGAGLNHMVPGNQSYTYHYSSQGHTLGISDNQEDIENQYAYSSFDRILGQTEEQGLEQPFKYVGQFGVQHESEATYYMRARYYDAELGRFLKEDPIGFEGGLNVSLYVGGNPVVGIDPDGLESRHARDEERNQLAQLGVPDPFFHGGQHLLDNASVEGGYTGGGRYGLGARAQYGVYSGYRLQSDGVHLVEGGSVFNIGVGGRNSDTSIAFMSGELDINLSTGQVTGDAALFDGLGRGAGSTDGSTLSIGATLTPIGGPYIELSLGIPGGQCEH